MRSPATGSRPSRAPCRGGSGRPSPSPSRAAAPRGRSDGTGRGRRSRSHRRSERVQRLVDVLARQPAVVHVVAHREEALRRQHEVPRQRRAAPWPSARSPRRVVDVGGVEQVDAAFERVRTRLSVACASRVLPSVSQDPRPTTLTLRPEAPRGRYCTASCSRKGRPESCVRWLRETGSGRKGPLLRCCPPCPPRSASP
jgi:hypothetical protein